MRCPCCGRDGYFGLTVERLKQVVAYDPDTGHFTWLQNCRPSHVGRRAGAVKEKRYVVIYVDRKRYYAHRLAWFYMTGDWPSAFIDHINGNGLDNRLVNLRAATQSENLRNIRRSKANTSGFKGVSRYKSEWRAAINIGGKQRFLGTFKTPEAAHNAYKTAAHENFGEFARVE